MYVPTYTHKRTIYHRAVPWLTDSLVRVTDFVPRPEHEAFVTRWHWDMFFA